MPSGDSTAAATSTPTISWVKRILRFQLRKQSKVPIEGPIVVVHYRPVRRPKSMDAYNRRWRSHPPPRFPKPSSFRFSNVVSAVDSREFQDSIDAIAIICAKSHLSMANAHEVHRPPLGEIIVRPRPAKALSIVPEVNSSSEASASDDGYKSRSGKSSQWRDRSAGVRHVPLCAAPGLSRMQWSCEPIVGLSRSDVAYRDGAYSDGAYKDGAPRPRSRSRMYR